MNRYWDLTEQERSNLSYEDLEPYKNYQLMENGVVVPPKPHVLDIKLPELVPTEHIINVRGKAPDQYRECSFHTTDSDLASTFMEACAAGRVFITMDVYLDGESRHCPLPATDGSSETLLLYNHQTAKDWKAANAELVSHKKDNKDAVDEYDKALKSASDTMDEIYGDWRECLQKKQCAELIVATFENFVTTAGDSIQIAYNFLLKKWEYKEINDAFELLGKTAPWQQIADIGDAKLEATDPGCTDAQLPEPVETAQDPGPVGKKSTFA